MQVILQWKSEIVTILMSLATLWVALRGLTYQRLALPKKAFAVGGVSRVVFESPKDYSDDFEVRFRGMVVKRVTENHAFFMNTGNVEIGAEDFQFAASLVLPNTERIYECQVLARRPSDLPAQVTAVVSDGIATIALAPTLMNPGDYVAVRFMRTGERTARKSIGRIKGIPAVDPLLPGEYDSWLTFYPILTGLIGLGLAAFGMLVAPGVFRVMPSLIQFFTILFGGLLVVAAVVQRIRWRGLCKASYMGKGTRTLNL